MYKTIILTIDEDISDHTFKEFGMELWKWMVMQHIIPSEWIHVTETETIDVGGAVKEVTVQANQIMIDDLINFADAWRRVRSVEYISMDGSVLFALEGLATPAHYFQEDLVTRRAK